jgi:formate dehydrogenase subunit gamma
VTTARLPEPAEASAVEPGAPEERLPRFDRPERAVHWVNAVLFAVVMATAAILYIGFLSAVVGRRDLVRRLHVAVGLLLPVPLVAAVFGPWPRLRADVARLSRWDDDDLAWVRSRGRDRRVRLGKFNPGQKLNAAFTAGAVLVELVTGSIMKWFELFPVSWRTGATLVHDAVAIALFAAVAGHVAMAARDRHALRAMVSGWVPASWARSRRPKWYEEVADQAVSRDG